jgi:NDP-sugar pyrophosphorylase family protein
MAFRPRTCSSAETDLVSEIRHALILAAGLGTRLQPLTSIRAKPAIPLAGEPFIRRIARWLVINGVTDIVVNLHYLPATLTAVLGDGSDLGARVRYSWEQPILLGGAGGARRALSIIRATTFLIVNGDTLTDIDLGALAGAHAASHALVTLALIPNRDPHRYGGVLLDGELSVTEFVPRGPRAAGSFHFVGVQTAEAEAFRPLQEGQAIDSIGGAYDQLIASRPGSVRGFVSDAAFWDVGTVSDYVKTSRAFSRTVRESFLESSLESPLESSLHSPKIDPTARVTRSILWDDVEVGAGACIEDCIVTDRVKVPPGAGYQQMILIRAADGTLDATPVAVERG